MKESEVLKTIAEEFKLVADNVFKEYEEYTDGMKVIIRTIFNTNAIIFMKIATKVLLKNDS